MMPSDDRPDHPDVARLKLIEILLEAGAADAALPHLRTVIADLEREDSFLVTILRQQEQAKRITAEAIARAEERTAAALEVEQRVLATAEAAKAQARRELDAAFLQGQRSLMEMAEKVAVMVRPSDGPAN